jgi:hypothetical protein
MILISKQPLYPYTLAALPPLSLLAVNIQQVHSLGAWRLVVGSWFLAALIWLPLWHWLRRYKWIHKLTALLNVAALCMLAVPVAMIVYYGLPRDLHTGHNHPVAIGPDYYFIVLDSYTSHAVLLDRFGYDNTPFIEGLRSLGFTVGDCISPATRTEPSISAMLNPNSPQDAPGNWKAIYNSQIRNDLEARGYSTWAFSTGFVWTEILDADRFYQLDAGPFTPPTEFEILYLMQTPLKYILDGPGFVGARHRAHTLLLLDHLADAAQDPYSQFVFAHLIPPHPPFVFAADGSPQDWEDYVNPAYTGHNGSPDEYLEAEYAYGYIGQVEYISNAILPVLAEIIHTSTQPPVIILTGDHGPRYPRTQAEAYQITCAEFGK